MRRNRRSFLGQGGVLIASVLLHGRTGAAGILDVRLWPADSYTRLTLESDAPLEAQHFMAENPPRLVVDLQGMQLSAALKGLVEQVKPSDPFISGVRVGQYQPQVVRLVIDLKQPIAPQQFALLPVAAYRHRLVFDLYPTRPADPLLALLPPGPANAGRESAESRAVDDALGELIGRVDKPAAASAPASSTSPQNRPPAKADSATATARAEAKNTINRLIIVALDPGHGGEDPGAIGPTGLKEKDVVLQIARRLRERLNELPGMRAMLTRDDDYFVPLHERVARARRVQADLLVSIHADAFMNPQARGASVFALSDRGASSATARWMAQKENAADLVGGANFGVKDAGVLRTLLDMSTTAQIKDSLKVGSEVLSRIGKVGNLHKAQVEQAGFAVLKAPDIPSILVETAFISNPQEEERLRDPAYQRRLVEALVSGIDRYFEKKPALSRQRTT